MYLNNWNEVANDARPSLITIGTQAIVGVMLVNGAAMDASA